MPRVDTQLSIAAPPETAWAAVVDVESYPRCMENVESVVVTHRTDEFRRTTAWSVRLKGSLLRWTEEEVIDPAARRFDFRQVSGDLGEFTGHWSVTAAPGTGSVVRLYVDFDIGIPLLAEMLNSVAADALRENAAQMIAALEQRLLAATGSGRPEDAARTISVAAPESDPDPDPALRPDPRPDPALRPDPRPDPATRSAFEAVPAKPAPGAAPEGTVASTDPLPRPGPEDTP